MKRLPPMLRSRVPVLATRLAHKQADPAFLAEALNLLLKPSSSEIHPQPPGAGQYKNYLLSLVLLLLAPAADAELLLLPPKDLSKYVKRVREELRLRQLIALLSSHEVLTPQILTDIVLNPSLRHPETVPALLDTRSHFAWWTPLQHSQFDIVLLKKWDDLDRPLTIIKNLKQNMGTYLALIKKGQLSPFFERIVWKYHFDYIRDHDELYYVAQVLLRLAFLIFEASRSEVLGRVAAKICEHHEVLGLARLFLAVAKAVPSPNIKRLSIKYKPWQPQVPKAQQVMLAQALETAVVQQLALAHDEGDHRELERLLHGVVRLRRQLLPEGAECPALAVWKPC